MNRLFNMQASYQRMYWTRYIGNFLSTTGAQSQLARDLNQRESERRALYQQELAERETEDVLDRALLKAEHAKLNGGITAVEYHQIADKVAALKKLRFVEEYERLQDRDTYEYIKFKVAAEVGGVEEREAFALYSKAKIEEFGEDRFRLFSNRVQDNPIIRCLK